MASPHVAGAIARGLSGGFTVLGVSTKTISGYPMLYVDPTK